MVAVVVAAVRVVVVVVVIVVVDNFISILHEIYQCSNHVTEIGDACNAHVNDNKQDRQCM